MASAHTFIIDKYSRLYPNEDGTPASGWVYLSDRPMRVAIEEHVHGGGHLRAYVLSPKLVDLENHSLDQQAVDANKFNVLQKGMIIYIKYIQNKLLRRFQVRFTRDQDINAFKAVMSRFVSIKMVQTMTMSQATLELPPSLSESYTPISSKEPYKTIPATNLYKPPPAKKASNPPPVEAHKRIPAVEPYQPAQPLASASSSWPPSETTTPVRPTNNLNLEGLRMPTPIGPPEVAQPLPMPGRILSNRYARFQCVDDASIPPSAPMDIASITTPSSIIEIFSPPSQNPVSTALISASQAVTRAGVTTIDESIESMQQAYNALDGVLSNKGSSVLDYLSEAGLQSYLRMILRDAETARFLESTDFESFVLALERYDSLQPDNPDSI